VPAGTINARPVERLPSPVFPRLHGVSAKLPEGALAQRLDHVLGQIQVLGGLGALEREVKKTE
jgi:hypothetical protein